MALWTIKKIQAPVPATVSGKIGVLVTMIDKETRELSVKHVNVTPDGDGYDQTNMLEQLDVTYTPNDFDLA